MVPFIACNFIRNVCTSSKRLTNMAWVNKQFRYTKNTSRLTLKQRIFYEENGYLVIPNLVPQDVLQRCKQRFYDVINNKSDSLPLVIMRDVKDRSKVNKIQDFNHDEVLREYIEHKNLLDIVECFTGPNIVATHSMLIAKPPDSGYGTSKHPPHQDLYYFPFRPADDIVAAWTAIEPCNEENGCLYVSPGSHTLDHLYAHDYPPDTDSTMVNKFYHAILDLPKSTKFVNLEMQPGDTVFFHPLLIHGSGVNKSQGSRMSISCHYASAECNYIDLTGTIQSRIRDEIMEHAKQRLVGVVVEYNDIWRYKSTLVRGVKSSL